MESARSCAQTTSEEYEFDMTQLRVAASLLYLRPGAVGGSETYVRKLMSALRQRDDVHTTAICGQDAAAGIDANDVIIVPATAYSDLRRGVSENLTVLPALRKAAPHVLFFPANFAAPMLPLPLPQVVTVHDLQHHHFPQWFTPARRVARTCMFAATFLRARQVIAISKFTRDDLISRYRLRPSSVNVVYEGVDPTESIIPLDEGRRAVLGLESRFFLYPAMTTPHKNHRILIEAWALLIRTGWAPQLVFTGKKTEYLDEILRYAKLHGVENRVRHVGYLERDSLLGVMARADALLFPSLFEGFGLPVLEAMQIGVPVICSTAASLPEVAGNAGIHVDPRDPSAWKDAIVNVCDDSVRRGLVVRGYENAARFSWSRCAEETMMVLRKAVA